MNQLLSHLTIFVLGILLGFFILGKSVRTPQPPVAKTIIIDTCLTNIDSIADIVDTMHVRPDVVERVIIDTFVLIDSSIYPIDSLSNDSVDFYWVYHETPYGYVDHKFKMGYKRILDSKIEYTSKETQFIRPLEKQRTIILEPKHRVITTNKYVPFENSYNQIYLGASTMLMNNRLLFGPEVTLRTKNDLVIRTTVHLGRDQNNFMSVGVSIPFKKFSKN